MQWTLHPVPAPDKSISAPLAHPFQYFRSINVFFEFSFELKLYYLTSFLIIQLSKIFNVLSLHLCENHDCVFKNYDLICILWGAHSMIKTGVPYTALWTHTQEWETQDLLGEFSTKWERWQEHRCDLWAAQLLVDKAGPLTFEGASVHQKEDPGLWHDKWKCSKAEREGLLHPPPQGS